MPCSSSPDVHSRGPAESGKNTFDPSLAPSSYDELHRNYYKYVVALVRRAGVDESQKEDIACEILLRFFERDLLSKFDPTLEFEYQGVPRPARFKTFLSSIVERYLKGHKDKQRRLADREKLICDTVIGEYENTRWIDHYGGCTDSHEDAVLENQDFQRLLDHIRVQLALIPVKNNRDGCDLVQLFDAFVTQVVQCGECDVLILADRFNVSRTTMHGWYWTMRRHVAKIADRAVPAKRGAKPDDLSAPEYICPECRLQVTNAPLHRALHDERRAA